MSKILIRTGPDGHVHYIAHRLVDERKAEGGGIIVEESAIPPQPVCQRGESASLHVVNAAEAEVDAKRSPQFEWRITLRPLTTEEALEELSEREQRVIDLLTEIRDSLRAQR
jgi:hypothetical protein